MTRPTSHEHASQLLRQLAGPNAQLREDQTTAIDALLDRCRVLVVQRTGWGKSAVYFIATRLLRNQGAGPTLLISPLLALMRDQLAAAEHMGLTAATINSTNLDQWEQTEQQIAEGAIDLLLISPERLNHPRFRREILDRILGTVGMLVIDEAHCISDHGHDFRPDYRRIATVLRQLHQQRDTPLPVLACTATATDRVIHDIHTQLTDDGQEPLTFRGPLARNTLTLNVVHTDSHEHRLAWIAAYVHHHRQTDPRAGIVYTLTVAEAEHLSHHLTDTGLHAPAYTSRLEPDERHRLEDALSGNDVDVVVATSALSMGYDKPDLGFVLHLGAPSSPVAYYQAIGRAGRDGQPTTIACLPTPADEQLWDHFDIAGVPTAEEVHDIIDALDTGTTTSIPQLETRVNIRRTRLTLLLKVLDVEGVIDRVEGGYLATGTPYQHDHDRYQQLLAGRRGEHQVMRDYLDLDGTQCRMQLLTAALDDPDADVCGRCDVCTATPLTIHIPDHLRAAADTAVRGRQLHLPTRRRWPAGLGKLGHDRKGNIPAELQLAAGHTLSVADGSGYAPAVTALLEAAAGRHPLPDQPLAEVCDGMVAMLAGWQWERRPTAIVTLPSDTYGAATCAVADRLGQLGKLPVHYDVFTGVRRPPQAAMSNSAHQAANALSGLTVTGTPPAGPVLLFDAVVRSSWTITVAGVLLAEAQRTGGHAAGPVLPAALHATHSG